MSKIVAIMGGASSGKTTAIKAVHDQLSKTTSPKGDICVIIDYKGKKIGFASMGDAPEALRENIRKLIDSKCDIIITACRSRGATTEVLIGFSKKHEVFWIGKPSFESPSVHKDLKLLTVQHVLLVINSILSKPEA